MITVKTVQKFLKETTEATDKAYVINEGKDASIDDLRLASEYMHQFTRLIEKIMIGEEDYEDGVIPIMLEFIDEMEKTLQPLVDLSKLGLYPKSN